MANDLYLDEAVQRLGANRMTSLAEFGFGPFDY
jgi:hypothetical protein